MTQASITSSASFQARLLSSEQWRAGLLAAAWMFALAVALIRRALGGVVMSVDAIFYSTLGVLLFAIAFEVGVVIDARRHQQLGRAMPSHRWIIGAVVDLLIPIVGLAIMENLSPRGAYAALSGPTILGLPLVIMMSILRLRPKSTLAIGMGAGVGHWALATIAIMKGGVEHDHWPVLFSYGAYLMMTGIAAAAVAAQVRKYVREAIDETLLAEQTQRALASVEQDLNVARDIQRGLMPSTVPPIAGFELAGMARPAQQTGGDYYDYQPLADGRLVVALADVTGHGIGPALVMAVCRAYARAAAPQAPDPAALLAQINALIHDDLSQTGRFITMVIAVLSPGGRVDLVSAGHGPTLLYRVATGEVEAFGGDGPPLGIDTPIDLSPHHTLQLEPGDALLLLTDGFMEWARSGDGQQFGSKRLKETLSAAASGSAKSILEKLDSTVQAFAAGEPQRDDTTAVAIKRV